MQFNILNYNIPDRINKILTDKDIDDIYLIIGKHLRESVESLKKRYEITTNYRRRRIFINGSYEDIAEFFYYASGLGTRFESITEDCLRIDISEFVTKFI